ncbi:cyclase family protein [Corallococcus sp. H22C18031201]|uniref:cyclase family protein n=1 Tax=Citreicoccus inhibens TaxID=2849499 RepID=UPI000E729B0A|nr:cyclase family protein [Citreicoccus inhibens]MBU8896720.1 cyclase family protein [Citreicoccus inhibens]RJS21976.1 cyclase family protein [Corallococcus sp. H22C18031201]
MTLLRTVLATGLLLGALPVSAEDAPSLSTAQDIQAWKARHTNWRRWGAEDQLGAANLITRDKRKQAAKLVRDGVSVSIAHTVETQKAADVPSPLEHDMLTSGEPDSSTYSSDRLSIGYHGWSHTHIDALCHIFAEGQMYNGYPQGRVNAQGCAVLSINALRDGLLTRGVLIDMPALLGVPYLEPGTPITAKDLDAWEKKTQVRVTPGDAVIVRTGRWARRAAVGPWDVSQHSPGLHASTAEWFRQRGVAVVATDVGADVMPSGVDGVVMPIHRMLIHTLGVYLIDNADPEALSRAAAERRRYDFLFTLAPLAVDGGTGSPANPIATF